MRAETKSRSSMNSRSWKLEAVYILCIAILLVLPTGFEKTLYRHGEHAVARVLDVNNSQVISVGVVTTGKQRVQAELLSGARKGEVVEAMNFFEGQLERDHPVVPGDKLLLLNEYNDGGELIFSSVVDHYRLPALAAMVAIFAILLVITCGPTGLKTVLSFTFTLLLMWKAMIPWFLRGISPLLVAMVVGNVMTAGTILLVSGFCPRSYGAILSSLGCSLITLFVARIFIYFLNLDGSTLPWLKDSTMPGMARSTWGPSYRPLCTWAAPVPLWTCLWISVLPWKK